MENKNNSLSKLSNEELDEMYKVLTRSSNLNLTPMAKSIQEEMLKRHDAFFNNSKKDNKESKKADTPPEE